MVVVEFVDIIGFGLYVSEVVLVVFGLFVCCLNFVVDVIIFGVNIGNDIDIVVIMVGVIFGVFYGVEVFFVDYLMILDCMNYFDLVELVR